MKDRPNKSEIHDEVLEHARREGRRLVFTFFSDALRELEVSSSLEDSATFLRRFYELFEYFEEHVRDDTPVDIIREVLTMAALKKWRKERTGNK